MFSWPLMPPAVPSQSQRSALLTSLPASMGRTALPVWGLALIKNAPCSHASLFLIRTHGASYPQYLVTQLEKVF